MSFAITLQNASLFKKIVNALGILEEPIFRVKKDRLYVRQQDKAHVLMVHLEIPKETFSSYDCDVEGFVQVKNEDLLKCLRRVKDNQFIGLSISEETADKLTLTLSEKAIKDFTLPIFEPLSDERAEPAPVKRVLVLDTKIKMDTVALSDSMSEFKGILSDSDRLQFMSKEGCLILEGKGESRGLIITHQQDADIIEMEVPVGGSIANYGVTLLSSIIESASQLSGVVLLEFKTEYPLRLTYELPFNGLLQYYLAPRIKIEGE